MNGVNRSGSSGRNEPGTAGKRELDYDSQQINQAIHTAFGAQSGEPGRDKVIGTDVVTNSFADRGAACHGKIRGEARSESRRETGDKAFKARAGSAGSDAHLPTGLGGDRREHSERAGHAVRLPVLPHIAPRLRTGAGIPQDAPRAMGEAAPGGGIGTRCRVH